ncbi:MAG TPA: hypothetical protein VFA90_15790 [Terriglobales bacterium]|nr:hypothetical protein [Terriglobales bacterium]
MIYASGDFSFPTDFQTNFLMLLRWIHFMAGITWIGLLYFLNLIGIPFSKELDPAARARFMPGLMLRVMWWFRWSALVTVLAGLAYWGSIVGSDAHNGGGSAGLPIGTFFLTWTVTWAILYALLIPGKGLLNKGWFLAILYILIVAHSMHFFLHLNRGPWESNRLLSIGIGGGIGWMMLLNVWGVVWRIQKRLIAWTKANAENGTPIPDKAARMQRMVFLTARANAWLSIPLLFFMGAASHYPMFGR